MSAHSVEDIKQASGRLRGTLLESLANPITGALNDDDQVLIKYHGSYQQDDRDIREERRLQKLEPAHAFMIRTRTPGGVITPTQWLQLDAIATTYAERGLRITTRQAFQFHGVIKGELKATMQAINAALIDTLAACGDVNRNVVVAANPLQSSAHAAMYAQAAALSEHLLPNTRAYYEIWLDEEQVAGSGGEDEPIYGKTYLPRKFKIVIAVPPSNDVDVYAHDLGFIAILDPKHGIDGYNVTVGGGMAMTHGEPETYPRTADVMGYCRPDQAIAVAEAVVSVQRDWGDRVDRKHARLKYTIEDRGLDAFRAEVEQRSGVKLAPARPFSFTSTGDRYGWTESDQSDHSDRRAHLTLFIENGRVKDVPGGAQWLTGLRRIAEVHDGDFRLTANQNLIIANVPTGKREAIEALVAEHGLATGASALRRNAMACVALPTCGLALAESERYLPDLITALEQRLAAHGLAEDDIVIRMTGCPNGCSRPYLAEIGLVGKGPGRYNLYLGAAFDGSRLSKLYAENLDHAAIIANLDPIFAAYKDERPEGERFGDYTIRAGFVAATGNGADFHHDTGARR